MKALIYLISPAALHFVILPVLAVGQENANIDIEKAPSADRFVGAYIDLHRCFNPRANIKKRKQSIDANLQSMKESGLNTIIPKSTSSSGTAHYPSQLMKHRFEGDWDPLGYFIERARQREMSVWPAACILVSGHDRPRGILEDHPDWAMRDPDGNPIGFISPAHPDARKWVVTMLSEIVRRYHPDGLVLDYLRYHNRPIQLDERSHAEFESQLATIENVSDEVRAARLQEFREQKLTQLMQEIHDTLKAIDPDLKLAIYSWGPHVIDNHRVGQDWKTWVERGYLDMVNVSGYLYPEQNGADYLQQLEEKLQLSHSIAAQSSSQVSVTFALGVRTSHGEVKSASQVGEILQSAQRAGVDGVAFFTWSYLQPWLKEVVDAGSIEMFASHP